MSIWMNQTILLLYTIHFYLYYFQSISLASRAAINQLINIFFTPHSIRFSFGRLFHLKLPFELIWIILYLKFLTPTHFYIELKHEHPRLFTFKLFSFFNWIATWKIHKDQVNSKKRERKKRHILDAFCLNLFRNFCSSSVKSDDETRNSRE